MSTKLIKKKLTDQYFSFNAMAFIPSPSVEKRSEWAIFTHGYTASKSDCLNWAQRLSEVGIPCAIFDLPGHHLGSYNKVNSFEDFRDHSHECFLGAFNFLKEQLTDGRKNCTKLILGGHSLGALLAIKALNISEFDFYDPIALAIGIGIGQHKTAHLFETSFYEKTLNIRRQLVDPHLDSDFVFPWIKEEKQNMQVFNKRVHMITGLDDVVVGEGGLEAFRLELEANKNDVTFSEPKKLPHHEPSMAATHIYNYLKNELGFTAKL